MERRDFLTAAAAALVVPGTSAAQRLPLTARSTSADRVFRVGYSGFVWQEAVEEGITTIARFGFKGIEPFRQHVMRYLQEPQALKDRLDAAGIAMITCSNGGPGMTTNFIDPTRTAQTIEDHVAFARDFVARFGCSHFKINLGSRPADGPTDDHLRTMAATLTELGKRTADLGLRLAPHPHIWSPLERPEEIASVMELTDPQYVYFTADTAHLSLGGTDPVRFVRENYSRIAAYHFKDTPFKYRGHTGPTPTREEHQQHNLYTGLGSGGVDFPAITRILEENGYAGWITLDYDPPRDHEGTIDQQLAHNKRYVTEILGITIAG